MLGAYGKTILIVTLSVGLTGCLNKPKKDDPAYAPVPPAKLQPPPNTSGSLYQEGYEKRLFEDRRAHRVGDMLTIRLIEQTNSQKIARTQIDKESTTNVGLPTVMGKQPGALRNTDNSNTRAFDLSSTNEFQGQGLSDQSNNLTGTITVTVSDVMPNGYLVVRGEKWMTLNQGDEFIRFTGIVRPEDVDSNNMVDSTRVADSRITYSGTGQMADSNAMGWLAKFFGGLLFPF